jgi:hypothetical protein
LACQSCSIVGSALPADPTGSVNNGIVVVVVVPPLAMILGPVVPPLLAPDFLALPLLLASSLMNSGDILLLLFIALPCEEQLNQRSEADQCEKWQIAFFFGQA